MTFAEAVDALKALADEGIVVEATVWGKEDDSYELASLGGLLVYAPGDPAVLGALGGELRDAAAATEIATVFEVGGSDYMHTFALWPNRFVAAEVDDINGVQIVTRDGRLQVRKNRPWYAGPAAQGFDRRRGATVSGGRAVALRHRPIGSIARVIDVERGAGVECLCLEQVEPQRVRQVPEHRQAAAEDHTAVQARRLPSAESLDRNRWTFHRSSRRYADCEELQ